MNKYVKSEWRGTPRYDARGVCSMIKIERMFGLLTRKGSG